MLFRIYDIGGIGTTDSDVQESIDNSDAAVYVFDVLTFDMNIKAVQDLLKNSSPLISKKKLPIVIISNKNNESISTNLQNPIKKVIESYFGSEIKKMYVKMGRIGDQIFPVLQWIYNNTQKSSE